MKWTKKGKEAEPPLLRGGEVVVANAYREDRVASRKRKQVARARQRPGGGSLLFLAGVLFQDYELMKYSRLSAATTRPAVETGGNETRGGGFASANWSETTKTGAWMSVNLRAVLLISN